MPAHTLSADTAAIRAFGSAYTTHAAALAAVASALRSIPAPGAALGPVGAGYLAALAGAVADQSDAVAALEADTRAGGCAAELSAAGYEAAGRRAAELLPRV